MSNHVTQKAINLHYRQVNEGKMRRTARQIERKCAYIEDRTDKMFTNFCAQGFSIIMFTYSMMMVAVFLKYLI